MEVSALTHPRSAPGLRGPSPLLRLQSDERLIALTRRGQHAAFETLFSRYQSRLLSFCRHMLASREDAEDVLQEVFAAAFNAVLADEREINVRPWLYRIARNRSLNHLRRASATGVDSMDVHFADHGLSTGDRVLRRESFHELIADVHQLPESQRTALLLREIDALSYDQIAHAMETTIPSVKSLLVRARISLAEAAEARKLSCEEVRLELGETAEGLIKLSTPARRHVRGCERCRCFKQHLKDNNHALAAILPVGPLLVVKKLLLTKLGSTASAGGAHVAGAGGASVGAGATVGAGAVAGAGAAGGASLTGGLLTAGAGAIATKAVAGLAAAAILAGAVAASHAVAVHHRHPVPHPSYASARTARYTAAPVVVREQPQPLSYSSTSTSTLAVANTAVRRAAHHRRTRRPAKAAPATLAPTSTETPAANALPVATAMAAPTPPASPQPATATTQVTEVTTETTQLPAAATSPTPPPTPTTTSTTTTSTTAPSGTAPPAAEPAPAAPGAPAPPSVSGESSTPPSSTPAERPPDNGGTEAPAAAPAEVAPSAATGASTPQSDATSPQAVAAKQAGQLAEGEAFQRPLKDARRSDFRRRGDL
jgi:RNA polymerase sigma factor (sigma-70 family)